MTLLHRIAGGGVGGRTSDLLRGFTWIGPSAMIVRVVSGVATLMAARWLGPARFGEASLALAVTFWILIPLFCGLPASMTHFIPQNKQESRDHWATVGTLLCIVTAALTLAIGYLLKDFWAARLGVSVLAFERGLIWCSGFAVFTMVVSLLSGYENFRARAFVDVGMSVITFGWVVVCYFARELSPGAYIWALTAGYLVSGVVGYRLIRVHWHLPPDWKPIAQRLLAYGLIGAASGIVSALFNSSGRLVANRFLSVNDVGILAAYQGGSVQMALFLIAAVSQVFFPIASRTPDTGTLLRKLTRTILFSMPMAIAAFSVILVMYFTLLGKQYPWNFNIVLLFSVAGFLTWWFGMLSWFLAARGERGLVIYTLLGILSGGTAWVLCLVLIPRYGLSGAAWAQGAGCLMGILLCYLPMTQGFLASTSKNPSKPL